MRLGCVPGAASWRVADVVWEELERRGATIAVVPFSGRAGEGGWTGTVTLSRVDGGELVDVERWGGP